MSTNMVSNFILGWHFLWKKLVYCYTRMYRRSDNIIVSTSSTFIVSQCYFLIIYFQKIQSYFSNFSPPCNFCRSNLLVQPSVIWTNRYIFYLLFIYQINLLLNSYPVKTYTICSIMVIFVVIKLLVPYFGGQSLDTGPNFC